MRGFTVHTDEVFALVDEQRRASIRYVFVFAVPAALVLLTFVIAPAVTEWRLGRVPLPWLVLGPIALFSIVAIAWRHDRRALQIENDWSTKHSEPDR